MVTSHSLRSQVCQTIITRRPAGRSARLMLANAAPGSSKEHGAEPGDCQVEAPWRKSVDLCVGVLEGDVAQPLGPGEFAGALDRGRGDVDPNGAPCLRRASGLSRGLPGPAADVEDMIVELDANGRAQ